MKTSWIVRIFNVPIFFPAHGARHMAVPSDREASRFATQEDAIYALQRRGISVWKGVRLLEVPNGEEKKAFSVLAVSGGSSAESR